MVNRIQELGALGFGEWQEEQAKACCSPTDTVARVAAVDREQLLLLNQTGPFRAKLSGSYLHRHRQTEELPWVGDWVVVQKEPSDDFGLVQGLLGRRTLLRRKAVGSTANSQIIAANLDTVVIVNSCHFDFNLKRLERYLVMVMDGGAEPQILLTKTDLVSPEVLAGQIEQIRAAGITAPVLPLSNLTKDGLVELKTMLQPARTYCFVGSSGVGKSTLINELIGRELLETKVVSATGEGRHTTVRRELVVLPSGPLVIDNPGMREFGVLSAESGIEGGFANIASLAAHCRYRDCTHSGEPGCAVQQALETGELDPDHYDNYKKLTQESEFSQMSYADKRKKDRAFGRFLKSAKKDLDSD